MLASCGWTPGGLAERHVQNDLDLAVIRDGQVVGLPWALPHFQTFIDHSDSLELLYNLPAIKTINHLDNVELVDLDSTDQARIALLCPTMEMRNSFACFGKH